MYDVFCTMYYALCTMYYILYMIYYILYTIGHILYTAYYTINDAGKWLKVEKPGGTNADLWQVVQRARIPLIPSNKVVKIAGCFYELGGSFLWPSM